MEKRTRPDLASELSDGLRRLVGEARAAETRAAARAPVPLDAAELAAIRIIGDRGVVRMRDLAVTLAMPPSSATSLADRLIAKELAVRERNEADRRVVTMALAPKGRAIHRDLSREHERLCADMLSGFTASEQAMLIDLMGRLSRRDAAAAPARKRRGR
jgi:DNA-binding MarR family transcriptional regulator